MCPYIRCFCGVYASYKYAQVGTSNHTFLGLLAKIKCSICSLEFDNSNGGHCPPCYLTYFSGGPPNSGACTAGLAAWPWHCTTALAKHPLIILPTRTINHSFISPKVNTPNLRSQLQSNVQALPSSVQHAWSNPIILVFLAQQTQTSLMQHST